MAVVTDGSRVLGLGNIGPEAALPTMEGKALLFKYLGGVDAFPICLETGDNEELKEQAESVINRSRDETETLMREGLIN